MTLSNVRATFGLNCRATPTTPAASGTAAVGDPVETVSLPTTGYPTNRIISFDAVLVGTASDLIIDISDLDSTGSTSWTGGTAQVDTNTVTAASGITANGNAQIIITCAGMTGSPKTINVPVTTAAHTTATLIATALRAAAAADSAVAAKLTIGGTGADITATVKATSTYTVNGTSVPVYPANDATLNIAIQNGTCTGITTAGTSTNTTAGVATAGVYAPKLSGLDFEGQATGGLSYLYAWFVKNSEDSSCDIQITSNTKLANFTLPISSAIQVAGSLYAARLDFDDFIINPTGSGDYSAFVTVTLAGYQT